jgi:hypothetical protein
MIIKSISKVKLEDGQYAGKWSGLMVTVKDQEPFKVGRATKQDINCLKLQKK